MMVTEEGRVRVYAPHHKNDRRSNKISSGPIDVLIPPGPLTELLLFWLEEAWDVVHAGSSCSTVFSSRGGGALNPKPFSPTNFSDYFSQLVKKTAPVSLANFTATMARSSFVEAYTRGTEEKEWEGAAAVMGNSTSTWKHHYSSVFKNRAMQEATDSFSSFLDRDGSAPASTSNSTPSNIQFGSNVTPIFPRERKKRSLGQREGVEGLIDEEGGWVGWGEW
jgi:hypothetical protein